MRKEIFKKAGDALQQGGQEEREALLPPLLEGGEKPLSRAEKLRAMDLLARARWERGLREEALRIWRDASSQAGAQENAAGAEIPLLCNFSHALLEGSEVGEALKVAASAVEKCRENPEIPSELAAFALFTLSSVQYRQKDLEKARASILEAKDIWEKAGNRVKAATCMNNLGRIHEELGDLEAGVYWHQKAVAERRHLPDKSDLAFSLGNLGVALAQAGQWRKAADSLWEALAVYASLGMEDSREYQGYKHNLEICERALNQK